MNINIFHKLKNYAENDNINRNELRKKIKIATAEILKYKLTRKETNRIINNISNVAELFQEGFSNINDLDPYLHRETKQLIEEIIKFILTNDIPNIISNFSVKNNISACVLAIFIDYLTYGDTPFSTFNIDNFDF
jgi:hypothetical protein